MLFRSCQGKSIINSINFEDGEEKFHNVLPLVKRYGAAVIIGSIDEDKQQAQAITRERKLAIAQRAHRYCTEQGVPEQDLIFDPLVFPCATGDENYIGSGVLQKHGVEMIGAKAEAIEKGEDRLKFKEAMQKIGLDLPVSGVAHTLDEAREITKKIGRFPVIIRPAYTLGGTGGGIAYNREEFDEMAQKGLEASPVTEILVEESLIGWKEYETEVMRDKADNCVIVCSIEKIGRAHV